MNRIALTVNTTTQGPPNQDPYSFQYSAGRFPGHVGRTQSETGDGFGHVHGTYSYAEPKMKVRVEYDIDENDFHPSLMNYEDYVLRQPSGSEAVRLAAERHRILYDKIAAANSQPTMYTASVQRERDRHFYLYNKIAAEHAAIGAERAEAQRLARNY